MFSSLFTSRLLAQSCPRTSRAFGLHAPNATLRFFSSSVPRTKATNISNAPKQIPYQKPKTPAQPKSTSPIEDTLRFAGRRPSGFAKLERKVAKEGNLTLYKSPSHRGYILGAYGAAFFCFAYAVYNSHITFLDPLVKLPRWQQVMTGSICVVMSAMGTVFLMRTARLVKSVKAVSTNGQTSIRFSVRSIVPFKKPFEFDVLPRQIAFSRRLVINPEARRPEALEAPTGSKFVAVMKAPTKYLSKFVYGLFRSLRQIFTQEDMILLEVESQNGTFRMDASGYISEDLFVIGNPVSVKH
ncbi:hypothetical protein BDV18DRAFT_130529 [Aspergillus unguis]